MKIKMLETDEYKKTLNRQAVHEHCSEAVPFISELAKLGMISGWGNVVAVHVGDEVDPDEARYVTPSNNHRINSSEVTT